MRQLCDKTLLLQVVFLALDAFTSTSSPQNRPAIATISVARRQGMNAGTENSRWVQVAVLGLNTCDEYALVEAMDGSQEQFIVRSATAGQAWQGLLPGGVAWIHVTNGLLGRVLEIRHTLEQ